MPDIFNVNKFTYHDIDETAQKVYDNYLAQMPKGTVGKTISPSPVMVGYKMTGDLLSIKIGTHKFDVENNKHLYLETLYERKLTIEDVKILLYFKSKDGMAYLLEFSNAAWERMDESFEGHIGNTVFQNSAFPSFDENYIIQIINGLEKL